MNPATAVSAATKPRVAYVDLIKGFCMLFVIMFHCHVNVPGWIHRPVTDMYLAAFFVCAALFQSKDVPFRRFLVRKVNLLVVPWVGFAVALTVLCLAFPSLEERMMSDTDYAPSSPSLFGIRIYDMFFVPADLPSWFLPCMFCCSIMFYAVSKVGRGVTGTVIRAVICLGLAAVGIAVNHAVVAHEAVGGNYCLSAPMWLRWFFDFHIPIALCMLPFMLAGAELKSAGLLRWHPRRAVWAAISIGAAAIWIATAFSTYVSLYYYQWDWIAYIPATAGTVAVGAAAAFAGHFAPLNFLGRYSLAALCIHYILCRVIAPFIPSGLLLFAAVLAGTYALIFILIRIAPAFVGQKNLLPLPQG